MSMSRLSIVFALSALLAACGGGGGAWDPDDDDGGNPADVPSAPDKLLANAGDKAVSLGWGVPTTNGTDSVTYAVTLTPTSTAAQVTIVGTTALIRGLDNDTTYTFAVTAGNGAGTSPAASVQAKPAATLVRDYAELVVTDAPRPTFGFADPAPLRTAGGQIWLAYSSVNVDGSGRVLSSAVQVAHSADNGASYLYDQEVGSPTLAVGGAVNDEWHYRTPWLIEDSSDPDATRRFKLFAHKYRFNGSSSTVDYASGAIAMWTAAAPDGDWSDEKIVLGWAATPALLQPAARVDQLDPALQACQWIDEGGASVGSNGIDMVFNCVVDSTIPSERKIVLLRSADHAQSFSYVATLLQPADALNFFAESFSMPALLPGAGNAPVLLASPITIDGSAQGCVVFPIADQKTGKLFTENNAPLALQTLEPVGTDSGGCGWDRSIPVKGILMGDREGSDYTIHATGKSL